MNRGTGNRAPAGRGRFLALGLTGLAVVAGGALYLTRSAPPPGSASAQAIGALPATSGAGPAADVALAGPPVLVTVPPSHTVKAGAMSSSSSSALSRRTRPASSSSSATPSAGTPGGSAGGGGGGATGSASASATAAGSTPTSGGTTDSSAAGQVLALINQARATAGLPALTVTAGLDSSATAHNTKMASGCGLSHQCPGEAAIGDRETAAGVVWTAAGENIGEGGPVSGTDTDIAQMAVGLTQSMLNEQPPNDGHRMNILSSTFTHIGIAVYRDSSGTVWLTQDFSN